MRTQAFVALSCLSILSSALPVPESSVAGLASSLTPRSKPLHQVGPTTPLPPRSDKYYGDWCSDCYPRLKRSLANLLTRTAVYLDPTVATTNKRDLPSLNGAIGYFGDYTPDNDGYKKSKRDLSALHSPDIGYFGDYEPDNGGFKKDKRSDIQLDPGTVPDPTEPSAIIPKIVEKRQQDEGSVTYFGEFCEGGDEECFKVKAKREAEAKAKAGQFWGDFCSDDDCERKRDAEVTGMPIELPGGGKLCGSVDSKCQTEVVGGGKA